MIMRWRVMSQRWSCTAARMRCRLSGSSASAAASPELQSWGEGAGGVGGEELRMSKANKCHPPVAPPCSSIACALTRTVHMVASMHANASRASAIFSSRPLPLATGAATGAVAAAPAVPVFQTGAVRGAATAGAPNPGKPPLTIGCCPKIALAEGAAGAWPKGAAAPPTFQRGAVWGAETAGASGEPDVGACMDALLQRLEVTLKRSAVYWFLDVLLWSE